jgi:hypothetical protein
MVAIGQKIRPRRYGITDSIILCYKSRKMHDLAEAKVYSLHLKDLSIIRSLSDLRVTVTVRLGPVWPEAIPIASTLDM